MSHHNNKPPRGFDAIAISVASPEEILSWSHGEVKKPETINYRTQKPERDGLFCERIFGPTKNWECYCGKYKRIRYKGVICEKCGVEVTRSIVRRERMAHIKLAVPVTHIWFLRSTPSRLGLLLNLPIKTIEQVVYFASYIITDVNEKSKEEAKNQIAEEYQGFKKKLQKEHKKAEDEKAEEKLTKELDDLNEQHSTAKSDLNSLEVGAVISEHQYRDLSMKFGHIFKASTGAEALREIISKVDLEQLIKELQIDLTKSSGQKQKKLIKRIKFAGSLLKAGIKPEWMVMTVLPVIPPDLRPMVQLDGGRFAASDLNDLYRRVINRNNRLKKLMSIGAPEVICRNEKRMLQEAVDTLINNSVRQGRNVFNNGDKRKLRSLSDMLKGKQGRFRQNLLGKRVDYSGRSVIVVGPKLSLHQCGLPKSMALELFKPFVIGQLIEQGYAHNIKNAEKLIIASKKVVWDILEEVTKTRYVLLNRAPTLHRLGIQAFNPVLVEGKAIQIHPLVCTAFNADFDGDQMAVHVPLSEQAQEEARTIIVSQHNLLKPSAGEPITTPTQDMVLGIYYLTTIFDGKEGEGNTFADIDEAITSYRLGHTALHAKIKIRINEEIIETTVGRVILNSFIPESLGFYNKTLNKGGIKSLIHDCFTQCTVEETAQLCDSLKRIGFKFATKSGLSIGAADMSIPDAKEKFVHEADEIVNKINSFYAKGLMTADERYHHNLKVWSRTKNDITNMLVEHMQKEREDNDIYYMIDSGARGNWGQVTQLCGMKGLVANPAGKTIELPIKSNLKEGFSILEYFIATHGGRKGKSDTALKTAEAGYLTRRLVDAVQDIVIREDDCGTEEGVLITAEESAEIGEDLGKRIEGRILAGDVRHPKTGKIIAKKGESIGEELVNEIQTADVTEVNVHSVITCKTEGGICQKCYGRDLGTNELVETGTAVGIIAAQSIGEPGTQLTMRTFHMGGVAEGADITQGLTRVEELFEARTPKSPAALASFPGKIKISRKSAMTEITLTADEPFEREYFFPTSYTHTVEKGKSVKEGDVIAKAENSKETTKIQYSGKVTVAEPGRIVIKTTEAIEKVYKVPAKKSLVVKSGQKVECGQPLTIGHINLRDLIELKDIYAVQRYILKEVQAIYSSQGQTINDKHIEIIARQMVSKIRVIDPGNSKFLPGEIVDVIRFTNANAELVKKKKKTAHGERLLLGLTRIALFTDSWLSAASFQETIRVLVEASTTKRIDNLEGLKENVIIGKLIPAGKHFQKTT